MSCGSEHVTQHVLSTAETKDPINEELLMKMPKDATLINAACTERCTRRETLEVLSARPDFRHVSDAPLKNAEETKAPVGHKSTKRVIFTKRKRDAGRQSNHLDSCTQNSSPPSCRVRIKRGQFDRGEAHRVQVLQAVNEVRDAVTGLYSADRCTACTAASASCRTAPAEARSHGEASATTMGPQYRRLAIHDSWTHVLEPRAAREAKV